MRTISIQKRTSDGMIFHVPVTPMRPVKPGFSLIASDALNWKPEQAAADDAPKTKRGRPRKENTTVSATEPEERKEDTTVSATEPEPEEPETYDDEGETSVTIEALATMNVAELRDVATRVWGKSFPARTSRDDMMTEIISLNAEHGGLA